MIKVEKFFSINKFFLFFCLLFILEWIALQVVVHMRLTNMAKLDGERILGWFWPEKNIKSIVHIDDAKILKRSDNDATVRVLAEQNIEVDKQSKLAEKVSAVLTYYRTNNQWFLGKVEFE